MFPRVIMTELGRRMKTELEDERKTFSLYKSPHNINGSSPYIQSSDQKLDSAKILMTNDDNSCHEVLDSKRKISLLTKIKGKEEKIKYLKQTFMPNLQNVTLPKFFERKLEDSAEMLTSYYCSSNFKKKTRNKSNKKNHNWSEMSNEEGMFNESLKVVQTFENKIIKIYDKYETFKLQEEKLKEEIKTKMEKKLNSNKNRQFIDSKKVLQEFYNSHK